MKKYLSEFDFRELKKKVEWAHLSLQFVWGSQFRYHLSINHQPIELFDQAWMQAYRDMDSLHNGMHRPSSTESEKQEKIDDIFDESDIETGWKEWNRWNFHENLPHEEKNRTFAYTSTWWLGIFGSWCTGLLLTVQFFSQSTGAIFACLSLSGCTANYMKYTKIDKND